jgi:hypothetical protein
MLFTGSTNTYHSIEYSKVIQSSNFRSGNKTDAGNNTEEHFNINVKFTFC